MPNYNTILIKRRTSGLGGAPTSLSGGELAFNEVNSTLYYGSNAGVIAIGGSGSFVDRTSNQTISGNKTFSGSTTLSSTTFSSNSLIDFNGNKLTNIGAPALNTDAATKKYVDDAAAGAGSNTTSLSTEIYNTFVKLTDSRAVNLNGGGLTVAGGVNADTITTTSTVNVGTDLTVGGNLTVLGTTTQLDTYVYATSAVSVTNTGSGPALTITQTGASDIATFYDDTNTALIIKDGGNVGIGTASPNAKLTVAGTLSATQGITGASTLNIAGNATFGSLVTINASTTTTGSISGTAYNSYLVDFIIDGGAF